MYRRKTSIKIDLEHLIYRHFWTSTIKTCIFNGKFLAGLSNLLSTFPEEHLQSNVSERKSRKPQGFLDKFWNFRDNSGKPFSGLSKQQKMFREELIEKRFQKRKNHYFFSILSGFLLWVKKFDRRAEPANYVSVENFWGNFLRKPIKSFTPLWFLIQKICCRKFYL